MAWQSSSTNAANRMRSSTGYGRVGASGTLDLGVVGQGSTGRTANGRGVRRKQLNSQVASQSHHGMAFIVEAVVLLAFIALAITVFFRLFAYAETASVTSSELSRAVACAADVAEQFAVDPTGVAGYSAEEDGFTITCDVNQNGTGAGVMYNATINVVSAESGEMLYTLTTSKYESEVA